MKLPAVAIFIALAGSAAPAAVADGTKDAIAEAICSAAPLS